MSTLRYFFILILILGGVLLHTPTATALKAIHISPDMGRIEITPLGELYEGRGDSLQIETASNADGTSGRLSVRASLPGSNPNWIVFALHNPTDSTVERWISADRYTIIGSGIIWPDLDAHRIEAITPSVGFVPERINNERADLFRITLEPGQTITYIAELSSDRYARIYLWKPLDYELKVRDRQLFNGVMLGLTGLLAVFLTAIFAANHKIIFPAASLVAWSVLAYLCVDFGFFHKLFQLNVENNSVYRASTESAMGFALVLFLGLFLRAPLWNRMGRTFISVWLLTQLSFIFLAPIDARLASTFARISFVFIGGIGFVFTLLFASRGQDRAISLIPTWLFLLVWIFGTGLTLTGHLSGDMVVSSLDAGLVLIVLLIGFTVTQFAFKSHQPLFGFSPNDLHLKSLAVDGSGAGIWEWNPLRKKVKVSENIELFLGLNTGELNTGLEDFCRYVHPADLERFKLSLEVADERHGGHMQSAFRLRKADNSYRWYEVASSPILSSDGRSFKSVGLMRDVTDSRRTQERLLQDAVKCSLTGLPHRQLLIDRLLIIMRRAKTELLLRPTMMVIDLDKFKTVNVSYGLALGDSLLLAVTRRLQRYIEDEDTLARIGSDRFALLLVKERTAAELASLAENVRRSLRSPMTLGGQEVVLTSSIGIAVYDSQHSGEQDLLAEAEVAVFRAKRAGIDSIEIYRPETHQHSNDHAQMWMDLEKSIEKGQLKLLYRPIVYLPTEELAGFEAIVRWDHPRFGLINPFAHIDQRAPKDLFSKTLRLALARSLKHCSHWQKELPRSENPLFVSLYLPEGIHITEENTNEIRRALSHHPSAKGSLKIGIPESLIVVNPEQNIEILSNLQTSGAEIILDGFGMGYSSFPYLDRLPIHTVRASYALSSGNIYKSGSGGMLRAVISMAHELGIKVLIDGLETNEDVAFLRSISCEYGQGFYYGDYISQREILKFIRQIRKAEQRMQSRGFFRSTTQKKTTSKSKPSRKIPKPTIASDTKMEVSLQSERGHVVYADNGIPLSGSSVLDFSDGSPSSTLDNQINTFPLNPSVRVDPLSATEESVVENLSLENVLGVTSVNPSPQGVFEINADELNSSATVINKEEILSSRINEIQTSDDNTIPVIEPPPLALADVSEERTKPSSSTRMFPQDNYSVENIASKSLSVDDSQGEFQTKSRASENLPNLEKLPPRIAESLRKLAG